MTEEKNSDDVVAKVNGEDVTSEEVESVRNQFSQQGREISEKAATEQLIGQKVLFQEVEQEDFSVSEEEAESVIKAQLSQQGATIEDFKEQLSQQGVSYEDKLENVAEQLSIQKYLDQAIEEDDLEITEEETKEYYEKYKEKAPEQIPSYEEVKPQIVAALKQQKQRQAVGLLIEELRSDANIEYLE